MKKGVMFYKLLELLVKTVCAMWIK